MANTFSNMKVKNCIKEIVSKRRKRYTGEGFNLDLTYIKPNLIAMGFPAENLEGLVYRNHIDDVVKFLDSKHPDHYFIYNLCSERTYDRSKFHERVASYPFNDHNPPQMELIQPFCNDVEKWLKEDPRNVAAVHCKAGKGRTGVMICCYMLHTKIFRTASEALSFYGAQRTTDTKGVTIPSQRRYVEYYSRLVTEQLVYKPVKLTITEIRLHSMPTSLFSPSHSSIVYVLWEGRRKVASGSSDKLRDKSCKDRVSLKIHLPAPVQGDIKVEIFSKQKRITKEKMFHFWFNTFFVQEEPYENGGVDLPELPLSCNDHPPNNSRNHNHKPRASSLASLKSEPKSYILNLCKGELDQMKDKSHSKYPSDFRVEVLMTSGTARERAGEQCMKGEARPSPSSSSSPTDDDDYDDIMNGEDDDEDDDDDCVWDSGVSGEARPCGVIAPECGETRYRLLGGDSPPRPDPAAPPRRLS